MYLTAKKYFWTKNYKTGRQDKTAEAIIKLFPELKDNKLDYVIFQVGYWRKANQIHKWFVDNIQEGEDDCREYYVDRDKLKELLKICKKILDKCKLKDGVVTNGYSFKDGERVANKEKGKVMTNPKYAESLLPSEQGFFFGSYDYDQWYYQDIEDTVKIIEKVLKLPDGWDIKYSASW